MFQINEEIDSCLFNVDGNRYLMKPGKERSGIRYQGAGWEKGECGITIMNVGEKHNGNITCSLVPSSDTKELTGKIQIVVACKY